ncbi:methyltransferase domain-containing protein [Deinococcus sp. Arct2-2]|uniref:class I SAM-dependent methyltransferase n=1 Tax=Deinococcus sp. Arct2-2 TaxID=2568653 RepID=UPI0010A51A4B|nr:class I SAM-dependent methyltransferase [Deinococcus sp. Arct2-2]THF69425.1 methyltransferase domain-containing protein [Deinococcus sp. Arct2-2]
MTHDSQPAADSNSAAINSADWNAEHYRSRHAFVFQSSADLASAWLEPQAGERILDVGCGTGELTRRIAESGAEVVGVDASPDMIAAARAGSSLAGLTFEVVDAHALAYPDEFDAVFSNAALHWMKPLDTVFAQVADALKPGGRLVLEMGGAGNMQTVIDAVNHATATLGLPELPHPWVFPTTAQLATLLESAGLRVGRTHWFARPTPLKGEDGFRAWLEGFGGAWLAPLNDADREAVLAEAEAYARPKLWTGTEWMADYRRLRAVAVKGT